MAFQFMSPDGLSQAIEAILNLPLEQQATCVLIAAEMCLPVWKEYCQEKQIVDLSEPFIQCFDRWLNQKATSEEFNKIASQLDALLPKDLRREDKPYGGMAGLVLRDVAAIALDQCEDVHEDIFITAIVYAAGAYFRTREVAIGVCINDLSETELDFMADWWERCGQKFPQLIGN